MKPSLSPLLIKIIWIQPKESECECFKREINVLIFNSQAKFNFLQDVHIFYVVVSLSKITVIYILDDLHTLEGCSRDIQSNCSLHMSDNQTVKVRNCRNFAQTFLGQINDCLNQKNLSDSCSCFSSLTKNTTNLNNVKTCSLRDEMQNAKSAKNNCTTGQFRYVNFLKQVI